MIPFDSRPITPCQPRAEGEVPLRPGEYNIGDSETRSEHTFLRAWSGQIATQRVDHWPGSFRRYQATWPTVSVDVADESCMNSARVTLNYPQLRALAAELTRLADDMAAESPDRPERHQTGIDRYFRENFPSHFAIDRKVE